ncbi:hypothetical protein BDN67DRAFT_1006664 [Paxillus ammoniavirescens]|nr:hypothetical protein BDN67DRAFT_1006664 [Paxillus ammoniavirescens]
MATRRRIGVRVATTEAARRQLMQPVVCWEKVWVAPENPPPNSTMKVYKWVKTDKKQQFSDDEEEADEPLAPLPDEPEVVEGDEDMDQDEPAASVVPDTEIPTHDVTETNSVIQEAPSEPQTKPPSPTPPVLSLQQTEPVLAVDEATDILDASFKALDGDMNVNIGVDEDANQEDVGELDMSILGPDGTSYEGVHDLSQMDGGDALLGGPLMVNAEDPFAQALEPEPSDQEAAV